MLQLALLVIAILLGTFVTYWLLLRGVRWRIAMLLPTVLSVGLAVFIFSAGGVSLLSATVFTILITGATYGGFLHAWYVAGDQLKRHGMRW